jgi:hypothetical protein
LALSLRSPTSQGEEPMRYQYANASGNTICFTVKLAERRSDILVRHIDDLRTTMKTVNDAHPFIILMVKKKRLPLRARNQNAPPGKNSKSVEVCLL